MLPPAAEQNVLTRRAQRRCGCQCAALCRPFFICCAYTAVLRAHQLHLQKHEEQRRAAQERNTQRREQGVAGLHSQIFGREFHPDPRPFLQRKQTNHHPQPKNRLRRLKKATLPWGAALRGQNRPPMFRLSSPSAVTPRRHPGMCSTRGRSREYTIYISWFGLA